MRLIGTEHKSEASRQTPVSRKTSWRAIASLSILLLLCAPAFSADIYKHIGADGSVTYSDDPIDHSGTAAKPLALPTSVVIPAPTKASGNKNSESDGFAETGANQPFRGYQQFSINSPGNNSTIRSNNGEVALGFQLSPPLQAGHTVEAVVDGQSVASWSDARTKPVLKNVQRGSHQLRLEAFNEQGLMVGRSQTITFHLHQISAILKPAN